jgi:hypothetical protein
MVVGAGRLHHQFELSRPTAFAVGRCVLEAGAVAAPAVSGFLSVMATGSQQFELPQPLF